MINWFWQISHKFDTKLFFGDCDNTPVYNIFGSLLDFEMTTVPHLHEYWSSRDDQDMQLYLMKKMCAMNLLLHYHHARGRIRVTHEQIEKEMLDTFVIFIDAWLTCRKALLTLFLIFVRPNNDPARASPSCVLYRPAYLGKVSLQDYSACLYCLIIVTRKAVISYRAKVSWIRTNRRQAEMFSSRWMRQ